MAHPRHLIREAVVAAIDARPVFAGRSFSGRARSTEIEEMPVALVYALVEESTHYDVDLTLSRTATVAIEIKGAATGEQEIDDVLDDLCSEVEAAIYADQTLGHLALGLELVQTTIHIDGSGNARDGTAVLKVNVLYLTPRPA